MKKSNRRSNNEREWPNGFPLERRDRNYITCGQPLPSRSEVRQRLKALEAEGIYIRRTDNL